MSEQKDVTIQTDQCTLTIKTNKGSIYSLTDNKLLTAAGVIAVSYTHLTLPTKA